MIKKNVYSVKSVSIDTVIACVLAGISLACQIAAIIMSYLYQGKGIMFCKSAWKSPDGSVVMKRISGIVNGVLVISAVMLYILGWM